MSDSVDNANFEIFELGTVDNTVAKFGGIKLKEEITYVTPPIPMFGEACPNADVENGHALTHPAIYYAEVTDFKLIGGAAFPIIQNKSICHQYFSTAYWETSEQATLSCDIRQDQNMIGYCNIKGRYHYTCKVINLVGNGSYNYAHWMTEFLPQLVLLRERSVDLSAYKILVDSRSFPSMLEALSLLGFSDNQLIRIDAMTLNDFPEALWVSPVANVVFQRPNAISSNVLKKLAEPQHAIFHPEALKATRNIFLELVAQEKCETAPERIFIKRFSGRQYHARSVVNEAAIQQKLESEGFVSIDPSTLSFTEQIRTFSKAKYIVAASGAALLNMMWAPEGAKVIVLMNDAKVVNYWYFSNIAFAVGHQLAYVLGKVVDTGNWNDINHADFEISLQALVSALESFGLYLEHQPIINPVLEKALITAKEHYQAGRIEQAVGLYQEVLEIEPEHAEANYGLGVIEAHTGNASIALPRFERAVMAKPEQEVYWVSYITTLMQSGAIDSAVDALELGMKYGLSAGMAKKLAAEFTRSFDINRIGFLVHVLELVNHYACVWDLLPEGSFDVVLYGDAEATDLALFAPWKCNVVTANEVIHANSRYQYLVSNHPINLSGPPLIKQLGNINVRFMYAAGKSGWNLSEWNSLYDVILCFGPYHAGIFSESTDAVVVQMGYPRFDRYFTQQLDKADLHARYGCDPLKKTVVWLPTWKTLSSVTHFDAEISALTDQYNVIVKLHPLMPESEPERVVALQQHNFTHLITDSSDNLPLYQLADFMLFDYGGPPLAGVYADKNFILLNVAGAIDDDLTGKDSPDITIRKHLINVNPTDLTIAELLADTSLWEQQRSVRHVLRKRYFAPYYGFSSNVAANALLNLKYMVGKGGSH